MKPKTAILLIIVLVAVVTVIAIRHTDLLKPSSVEPVETDTRIWKTDLSEVSELGIRSADGTAIRFVRKDDAWRIAAPIDAKADSSEVEKLLDTFRNLQYEREAADEPELTGMDAPRWNVTLMGTAGATYTIKIGKFVPLTADQKTYV
ncbi:MAG: DUF4340 domain-containing protein, partial [Planctomycetota bacterium]